MTGKTVSNEIIEKVANLAKLTLKKGEAEKFQGQLANVFEYVGLVSKLETEYASETSQIVYKPNRFRQDVINKELMFSQKEAISQAKRTYNGFFVTSSIF